MFEIKFKLYFILRTKLKTPDLTGDQPISCCAIDARGTMFAYALSYDWHKVINI